MGGAGVGVPIPAMALALSFGIGNSLTKGQRPFNTKHSNLTFLGWFVLLFFGRRRFERKT